MATYNVLTFIGTFWKHAQPVIVEAKDKKEARAKALVAAKAIQERAIVNDREFRATVPEASRVGPLWNRPLGADYAGLITIDSVWLVSGTLDC